MFLKEIVNKYRTQRPCQTSKIERFTKILQNAPS